MGYYLNEVARKTNVCYELSDAERLALQKCLLGIYRDIKVACDKYNLCCMFSGGSALGAVRHQGFIPWDDDLDLIMPRSDFNKFLRIFENELADKYILSAQGINSNVNGPWAQVIKKNTQLLSVNSDSANKAKGVSVDVLPIDCCPDNIFFRILTGCLLDFIHIIANSIVVYKDETGFYKKTFSLAPNSKIHYIIRYIIGFLFSFLSYKFLFDLYDKLCSRSNGKKYCTIARGRNDYLGEIHPRDVFFPPKQMMFEGLQVNVPNKIDTYLKKLYGDYMEIPPPEKRERHFFIAFSLDTERDMEDKQ
ncbi:MAG: LicD family protein [Tannerella sp.]|nr:LicD family protein [Tannerella sp.]